MTIAFHLGQFVAVTMPEEPKFEGLSFGDDYREFCECDSCEAHREKLRNYESAKLAAIEAGVPFADQEEIYRRLCENCGVISFKPDSAETFSLPSGEVEIIEQVKRRDMTMAWKSPVHRWQRDKEFLEFRKVAIFKSPAPAKEEADTSDYKMPSGTVIKRAKKRLAEKAGRPEDFPWPEAVKETQEELWREFFSSWYLHYYEQGRDAEVFREVGWKWEIRRKPETNHP